MIFSFALQSRSGGGGVVGWCWVILPVPERPNNLNYSRAWAYCVCSRCEWELSGFFFSHLSFLFSCSLSRGDGPIQTEILSQRAVNPKTTDQSTAIRVNDSQEYIKMEITREHTSFTLSKRYIVISSNRLHR